MDLGQMLNNGIMLGQMSDGSVISEKVAAIVEKIRAYDSRLDVKWIPRDLRSDDDDAAFIVTERTPEGKEFPVISVKDESFMDERLLREIYEMDQAKQGDTLQRIDRENARIKAEREARHEEERQEAHRISQAILRSPKHTYVHDGVKFEG